MLATVNTSSIWIYKAGKSSQAINLASMIIEDIKANSHMVVPGQFNRDTLHLGIENNGLTLSDYTGDKWDGYEIEVIIEEKEFKDKLTGDLLTSQSNLLQLTVQVTWKENCQHGEEKLTAVIARR